MARFTMSSVVAKAGAGNIATGFTPGRHPESVGNINLSPTDKGTSRKALRVESTSGAIRRLRKAENIRQKRLFRTMYRQRASFKRPIS